MLAGQLELLVGFELGAAGADHVEAAGVAVGVDDRIGQLHVLVLHQAVRPFQETEEPAGGVDRLDAVIEAGDHVVAAGGLAAGEDHADRQRPGFAFFAGLEGQHGAAEGGLENFPHLFDVGDRGGRSAFGDLDQSAVGQRGREFRGVGGARLLQRRDTHCNHSCMLNYMIWEYIVYIK